MIQSSSASRFIHSSQSFLLGSVISSSSLSAMGCEAAAATVLEEEERASVVATSPAATILSCWLSSSTVSLADGAVAVVLPLPFVLAEAETVVSVVSVASPASNRGEWDSIWCCSRWLSELSVLVKCLWWSVESKSGSADEDEDEDNDDEKEGTLLTALSWPTSSSTAWHKLLLLIPHCRDNKEEAKWEKTTGKQRRREETIIFHCLDISWCSCCWLRIGATRTESAKNKQKSEKTTGKERRRERRRRRCKVPCYLEGTCHSATNKIEREEKKSGPDWSSRQHDSNSVQVEEDFAHRLLWVTASLSEWLIITMPFEFDSITHLVPIGWPRRERDDCVMTTMKWLIKWPCDHFFLSRFLASCFPHFHSTHLPFYLTFFVSLLRVQAHTFFSLEESQGGSVMPVMKWPCSHTDAREYKEGKRRTRATKRRKGGRRKKTCPSNRVSWLRAQQGQNQSQLRRKEGEGRPRNQEGDKTKQTRKDGRDEECLPPLSRFMASSPAGPKSK